MHDACLRRNNTDGVKRLRAPLQKGITLCVTCRFQLAVNAQRRRAAGVVHGDRMVDHQIRTHQRFDDGWVQPHTLHCRTHRGEIDDGRGTTQIVHDHPASSEGNFYRLLPLMLRPVAQRLQLLNRDAVFADVTCNTFKNRAQRKRQIIQLDA